jgi:hypothetical protein
MQNGDTIEIVKAIGQLKADLLTDIGEVKTQNAAQMESITNLRRELLGPGGRVTTVEKRLDDIEFWQNIKTIVVIPILLAIHKVMTAMGWKI